MKMRRVLLGVLLFLLVMTTRAQYYRVYTIMGNGVSGSIKDIGYHSALNALLNSPISTVSVPNVGIYISDKQDVIKYYEISKLAIRVVAGLGTISGLSADGIDANQACFYNLGHMILDASGNNLWFTEGGNESNPGLLRRLDLTTNKVYVMAGGGSDIDGTTASAIQFNQPYGLAIDKVNNELYIGDALNRVIKKFKLNTGEISTYAGVTAQTYLYSSSDEGASACSVTFQKPLGISFRDGRLYITDDNRVRMVDENGLIYTVAGTSDFGYVANSEDVLANTTNLNIPHDVANDSYGNFFIADTYDCRVREVDGNGRIKTICGNNIYGYDFTTEYDWNYEGIPLNYPNSVEIDDLYDIYITEKDHRVRKLEVYYIAQSSNNTVTVCEGMTVSISISYSAPATPTLQWQVSTDSENYVNLADDALYNGVTTNQLTINNTPSSLDGYSYRCLLYFSGKTDTSNVSTLLVDTHGSISEQPQSPNACLGGIAVFTASATGNHVEYYWWEVLQPVDILVSTATTNSYYNVDASIESKTVYLVVSNTCYSQKSVLVSAKLHTPIIINNSPESIALCSISTYTLSVSASGSYLEYVWQISDGTSTFSDLPNSESSTIILDADIVSTTTNSFRAVVYNACYNVTSDIFSATSANMFTITVQPNLEPFCSGITVSLSVEATGGNRYYQWMKIPKGTTDPISTGDTQQIFQLENVDASLSGDIYFCNVYNECYSQSSTVVTLSIDTRPSIANIQGLSTSVVTVSNKLQLSANPIQSNVSYTWYEESSIGINSAFGSTYNFSVGHPDVYQIYVEANSERKLCPTQYSDKLIVTANMYQAELFHYGEASFCKGGGLNLYLKTDTDSDEFLYEWYKDGVAVSNASEEVLNVMEEGDYHAVVKYGSYSVTTSDTTVGLQDETVTGIYIDTGTGLDILRKGATAKLTVDLDGTTYDWSPNSFIKENNQKTVEVSPLETTTFTVMVRGDNLCATSKIVLKVLSPTTVDEFINSNGSDSAIRLPTMIYRPSAGDDRFAVIPLLEYVTDGNGIFMVVDTAGNMVYYKEHYANDWNLVSQLTHKILTPGTYYYRVIILSSTSKRVSGGYFDVLD